MGHSLSLIHIYAERVFCVYEALKRGIDHETIWKITKIDWWFLDKMQHLSLIHICQ